MAVLPPPVYNLVPGQSPGDRCAEILRSVAGCSLSTRRDELAALVGRGVEDESFVEIKTNCATVQLGVLSAAGVDHPLLKKPTRPEMAFADLVQIGSDFGAWRVAAPSEIPPRGALLWYRIDGTNDDHVEMMLDAPDEHGGGGRVDNAVTIERSDVHWSSGRPLHRWCDVSQLGIPFAEVTSEDTEPHV